MRVSAGLRSVFLIRDCKTSAVKPGDEEDATVSSDSIETG